MEYRLGDIKDFDLTVIADFVMKRIGPIGTVQDRATPREQSAYISDAQQPDLVRLNEPSKPSSIPRSGNSGHGNGRSGLYSATPGWRRKNTRMATALNHIPLTRPYAVVFPGYPEIAHSGSGVHGLGRNWMRGRS